MEVPRVDRHDCDLISGGVLECGHVHVAGWTRDGIDPNPVRSNEAAVLADGVETLWAGCHWTARDSRCHCPTPPVV